MAKASFTSSSGTPAKRRSRANAATSWGSKVKAFSLGSITVHLPLAVPSLALSADGLHHAGLHIEGVALLRDGGPAEKAPKALLLFQALGASGLHLPAPDPDLHAPRSPA